MLECLAIDGTGVNAFAHNAKVLAINHLTREVIYSHISIAGFCNGEFHSSVVDSGIGEEANTVGTVIHDGGDVQIDITGHDFVFVVDK